ncbi:PspA/IM30 family protein [Paenibacillus polysaccharolyticus]|uniref:PspA/IM30 family protein n=2 Tax=Paenibacillus TaxID=44249 RepID=A0A5M9WU01_PAEAM|nr:MULTISPECIES: PspA/IM30 family protein [Paenibacillus]MDP9701056.1 phage shock protein A [Paenibacillus intestini]KAA8784958.1 PspA/IM30 family protein [Paenibacillus amylolyticus]MBY0205503.1 PspA/IM30 family protein [Paenibacillus cucumis (ex Kampfer et al. 2016)]MCP1131968.1 PspA/IM30 family protein [Paenibacillus polysaccharolyticus]MDT0125901.1 PspA/IM30 family protein [Paenibacillus sp. RRE4]
MSVFRRMRDITVASLNEHLEQSQDPVKLIDQFLVSTRQDIGEAEKLRHQYASHTRQMKQQADQAAAMVNKREEQASMALKAGEEHLAKLALQEKILHEEKMDQYTELYTQSAAALQELDEQINQLKAEYQNVYSKRQYYYARMQTIQLQQRMNQRGNYSGQNVPGMFNKLDDQVSDLEYEAQSLREIRRMGQDGSGLSGNMSSSALDKELERLKQKLNNDKKE